MYPLKLHRRNFINSHVPPKKFIDEISSIHQFINVPPPKVHRRNFINSSIHHVPPKSSSTKLHQFTCTPKKFIDETSSIHQFISVPTFAKTCGCPKCLSDTTILTNGFEQANLRPQLRAFGNFWRLKNCYSEIFKNNWFIQKVHIILFFEFFKTPQNKGYILI